MTFKNGIDLSIFPEKKGVYIVGGSIRDHLLGKTPFDFDIVVSTNPEAFSEKLSKNLLGHVVKIGHKMPIHRIITKDWVFDVSQIKGKNIFEDLRQRDFTINAMALSLESGRIVDCTNGETDLYNKTVRMVSKNVFKQDSIRLLRAFRIAAALNFEVESKTAELIQKEAGLLGKSAAERIREELFHLFRSSRSHHYLGQMANTGLLFEIFPSLKRLKGCRQNGHHAYDVFHHTLKAYFHMEELLNNLPELPVNVNKHFIHLMNEGKKALLKYAILLHDLGKPETRSEDDMGNIHFFGHAVKGADSAREINKKLKLPNKDADYVDSILRNHNRPLHLFKLHLQGHLTTKALTRFYLNCGRQCPDILLHSIADHQGKGPDSDKSFIEFAFKVIESYFESHLPKTKHPPLITGQDLIQLFGLKPSPLFKTILDHVEEARMSDQIFTKEDAAFLVKKFLNR